MRSVVIVNGYEMNLDVSECIQGKMASGSYEPVQTSWVREHLKQGERFVDVGASFGYYTSLASQIVRNTGRVFSFEPSPIACGTIRDTISRNGITNIELSCSAVGNECGEIDILLPPDNNLHSPSVFESGEGFTPRMVTVVSIDSNEYLNDGKPIDMIKIDVEGYEPNVIQGMEKLISTRLVKMIMCEFNSGWLSRNNGMTAGRLVWIIKSFGYRVLAQTDKVLAIERDGATPYELQDILFVRV